MREPPAKPLPPAVRAAALRSDERQPAPRSCVCRPDPKAGSRFEGKLAPADGHLRDRRRAPLTGRARIETDAGRRAGAVATGRAPLTGRARIETPPPGSPARACAGRAPLTGRARIETTVRATRAAPSGRRAPLTGRARIETLTTSENQHGLHVARPSRGARGLKPSRAGHRRPRAGRAPLTGRARIETVCPQRHEARFAVARPSRGARGLKLHAAGAALYGPRSRAPHGARAD